jgi:3-phenylpropionate/cinnamic acid dioxygenase small subunit
VASEDSLRRLSLLEERLLIDDLYARYAEVINDDRLEEWPDLFVEDCQYRLIPRENHERGLPLAIIRAESRGMLHDRVAAIRNAMFYAPHYWRHFISGVRIVDSTPAALRARANYCIVRTLENRPSELFQAGRYEDVIVRHDGGLLFKEKLCIYDSVLIPNSLVYPV